MSDDVGMSEETMFYCWGYRLPNGESVWARDYGTDGSWTPYLPELNMSAVDIWEGTEYADLRSKLDEAGLTAAVVIRRRVVERHEPPEDVTE